ncbi:unnamed protein product [Rhizoctonia solani]|uniref:AB hydrolase-1 domain-containing protein n=1 Tax=Rhizoctonia solani TaxID=456999 RepID=A0A8H3HN01_9AGAM|nr:unnamed protein product [Rhizoctonia solani]
MKNLPEGGVILCGHSMGGLLAAEVALASPPGRVIGLVSFDVPYLGVHPRVILSGIASLFKKEELRTYQTNDAVRLHEAPNEPCNQAPSSITSQKTPGSPPLDTISISLSAAPGSTTSSLHLSIPTPPVRVIAPKLERLFKSLRLGPIPQSVHDFLHFRDKHPGITGLKDGIVQIFEFGGCLLNPHGLITRYERLQRWGSDEEAGLYGRGWVNLWTTPAPEGVTTTGGPAHSDPPRAGFQSFLSRLSPTPSGSSLNSSSFQSNLFQTLSYHPSLCTSITSLESAYPDPGFSGAELPNGPQECPSSVATSVNEWTAPKVEENPIKEMRQDGKRLQKEKKVQGKKAEKERAKFLKAALKRRIEEADRESSHNFIVLPKRGTDHQWIRVPVVGAEDEIAAHCGLFFRDENPGYQQLVEDVGNIIRGFWDGEGGLRHSRIAG